ncbi:MAG: inner membrane CreD family protein [Candidatus Uhrbacteria bacterium]|nr:inner membrane CreD family protein [Candidatus Uhrbacteria bacterium]
MSTSSILSVRRLVAIGFIFVVTCIAWFVLAGVINARTSGLDSRLRSKVQMLWGDIQVQKEPLFSATTLKTERNSQGKLYTSFAPADMKVASDVNTDLNYEPRQKGLLWYNLYKVSFKGTYTVENPLETTAQVKVTHEFPSGKAVYDNFAILIDQKEVALTAADRRREGQFEIPPHGKRVVTIRYASQGLDEWQYTFEKTVAKEQYQNQYQTYPNLDKGGAVRTIKDFRLTAMTNFKDVDFPEQMLAPREKIRAGDGWKLVWQYEQLISGQDIGISVPKKLNPGPFVRRVTIFAPVALFFFFLVLLMISLLRKVPLHPMHFFFLATAFFSFHLLFAYLVDHLDLKLSFAIAAITSIFLTITYLRLVVGLRFAVIEAGLSQFVYLVAFTYSFFFEGYTGLIITVLAVLTLFVMMQLTGRLNWAQIFSKSESP